MGERTDEIRSQDPEELHEEIARTREDMSETIDEIQDRLDPTHLREEATERVREATIGRIEDAGASIRGTGMSMLDTVKQNPIPSALVGIGLGWLYMSRKDSSQTQQRGSYPYGQTRIGNDSGSGSVRHSIDDARESAMDHAHEWSDQISERTGQMGHMAQDQMQDARRQASNLFEENPLIVGAIAFGAGAVIGLSIPETQKEHEIMGEQRDQLLDQAKHTAQDKFERAEQVAETAFDEARTAAEEEAREQGLRG